MWHLLTKWSLKRTFYLVTIEFNFPLPVLDSGTNWKIKLWNETTQSFPETHHAIFSCNKVLKVHKVTAISKNQSLVKRQDLSLAWTTSQVVIKSRIKVGCVVGLGHTPCRKFSCQQWERKKSVFFILYVKYTFCVKVWLKVVETVFYRIA